MSRIIVKFSISIVVIATLLLGHYRVYAANPLDHTTLLNENDKKKKPVAPYDPEFDENPYYILSGEADQAMEDGDYYTAIQRIKDAIRVDPSNPGNVMLLSNLGMIYSYLDQDSLALKSYNDALSIAPAMTTILLNRALLNIKMGRGDDAKKDFSTVIEKDSTNVTARYYRGIMSLYKGDLNNAARDISVLRDIAPDSYEAWAALSSLYSLTGCDKEAIPYYIKLIEKDPAPEYYAALAGCYLATDQLSEASSIIAKGLKLYPDDGELYYYRAWLNKKYYRNEEASEDAKKALSLGVSPSKVAELSQK